MVIKYYAYFPSIPFDIVTIIIVVNEWASTIFEMNHHTTITATLTPHLPSSVHMFWSVEVRATSTASKT